MNRLYWNAQNPVTMDGKAGTTPFIRWMQAIANAIGTGPVLPGSITTSGLTMNTARLLGRTSASVGAVQELTVGSGLSLSSGTLTNPSATTADDALTVAWLGL